jgi:hypothetical protein
MIVRKNVGGEVLYNDGEFAEIQIWGIEGMEEGLFLEILQAHREDSGDTPEQFRKRFPLHMRLSVTTTTKFRPAPKDSRREGSARSEQNKRR